MILHLGRVGTPEPRQEGDLEIVVQDAAGEEEVHRLHVLCMIETAGARWRLNGTVVGSANSHCHRCLAAFERPVEARFLLLLQRGGESEEGGEDVVIVPETTETFDLGPAVREAVVLEEPIRLLCRSDCRGLCAQCGQDWNQGSCRCQATAAASVQPFQRLAEEWKP